MKMNGMFKDCYSLTSIDLTSLEAKNLNSMGYLFDCCSKITSLDLSFIYTENVLDICLVLHHSL